MRKFYYQAIWSDGVHTCFQADDAQGAILAAHWFRAPPGILGLMDITDAMQERTLRKWAENSGIKVIEVAAISVIDELGTTPVKHEVGVVISPEEMEARPTLSQRVRL